MDSLLRVQFQNLAMGPQIPMGQMVKIKRRVFNNSNRAAEERVLQQGSSLTGQQLFKHCPVTSLEAHKRMFQVWKTRTVVHEVSLSEGRLVHAPSARDVAMHRGKGAENSACSWPRQRSHRRLPGFAIAFRSLGRLPTSQTTMLITLTGVTALTSDTEPLSAEKKTNY